MIQEEVTVNKALLLEVLRENRNTHKAEFDEAIAGYWSAAVDALRTLADRIEGGSDKPLSVSLPRPEDHTSDYDEAISMLEWEQSDEVELDYETFRNFVLDEWRWKAAFTQTSSIWNNH